MTISKDYSAAARVADNLVREFTPHIKLVVLDKSDLIEMLREAHMRGQELGIELAGLHRSSEGGK